MTLSAENHEDKLWQIFNLGVMFEMERHKEPYIPEDCMTHYDKAFKLIYEVVDEFDL